MSNLQKPVGSTASFTAVVRNAEGVALPGPVSFSSDLETLTVVDGLDATLVGNGIETVTVTATIDSVNGPVSGSVSVDFVDNTPASVEVTVV